MAHNAATPIPETSFASARKSRLSVSTAAAPFLLATCFLLLRPLSSAAGQAPSSASTRQAAALSVPPRNWAVDATNNEVVMMERTTGFLRYHMRIADEKGIQLRDVIESRDGTVARLIQRDDRNLTPEEDKAEQQRLNDLLTSPSAFHKHINGDAPEKHRAVDLIRMLPDAMIYTYVPGQPQLAATSSGPQVVLDFAPNQGWKPPTLPAEALSGLRGRVWIDTGTHHMMRMEGDIFQSVNVGWGMLAKIYPGGKLMLEQSPAPGGRWVFTRFSSELTLRALMLKTIHQNSHVETRDHQTIAAMSYQDAIHTLLATPIPGR